MRAYLERIEPEAGMARFYVVAVLPTLLGDWAVIREWGRIGQRGTMREDVRLTEAEAMRAAEAHVQRKQRGQYRLRNGVGAVRGDNSTVSG